MNERLSLRLTDAFCGFKAYRVSTLAKLEITETGYAMPLELWVQAADLGLKIVELAVPLIYLDEARSFGGSLDNAAVRLGVYREVLRRSLAKMRWRPDPAAAARDRAADSPAPRGDLPGPHSPLASRESQFRDEADKEHSG